MNKRRLSCLLVLLGALLCASAGWPQGASFIWSPPAFDLTVRPGETQELQMNLVNEAMAPATFSFRLMDLVPAADGYGLAPPDPANPYSCASWLTVEPTEATVQPKRALVVKCTIEVPRDAKGARYGGVLCELETPEEAEEAGQKVEFRWQMATVLSLTVAGTRFRREAEITSLTADKPQRGAGVVQIKARLRNICDVHVFGQGRVTLREAGGRRLREYPLGQGRGMIIPGAELDFSTIFGRELAPGDYLAEVAIRYGGHRGPAQGSLPFTVAYESVTSGETIHEVGFYVTPDFRGIRVSPGSVRALDVALMNLEEAPIQVQVEARDVQFDQRGYLIILDSRDGEHSAAPWISLEPAELVLKPRQQRKLRYKVSVPRDTTLGGGYACLLFTATMTGPDGTLKRSQASTAVVLPIAQNAQVDGELSKVEVSRQPGTGVTIIAATMENHGNIHIYALDAQVTLYKRVAPQVPEADSGIEVIETERFEQVAELPIQNFRTYLLPGASRAYLAVTPDKLPAGEYRADVVVVYGGEQPALYSHRFTVEAESEDPPGAVPTSAEPVPASSEREDVP